MNLYFLLLIAMLAGVGLGFAGGMMIERRVSALIHEGEMQRLVNLLTIGVIEPKAERMPQPPSAEKRALSMITEDRIANAAAVIIDKYKEKGMTISEEEAMLQARAMLAGRSPLERVG